MVHLSAPLGGQRRKKAVSEALDWSCFSHSLGPHLTVGDMLHFDARRALSAEESETTLLALASQYNQIRAAWNGPLRVVAAFCPEPFNRQICGEEGSYHSRGMALDLVPLDDSVARFHSWLSKRWSGGLGHGISKGSVHIDTRYRGHFSKRADLTPSKNWEY